MTEAGDRVLVQLPTGAEQSTGAGRLRRGLLGPGGASAPPRGGSRH